MEFWPKVKMTQDIGLLLITESSSNENLSSNVRFSSNVKSPPNAKSSRNVIELLDVGGSSSARSSPNVRLSSNMVSVEVGDNEAASWNGQFSFSPFASLSSHTPNISSP